MFLDVRQGRQNEEARSAFNATIIPCKRLCDCLVRPSTALDALFFRKHFDTCNSVFQ
jgi:hypothetical protein